MVRKRFMEGFAELRTKKARIEFALKRISELTAKLQRAWIPADDTEKVAYEDELQYLSDMPVLMVRNGKKIETSGSTAPNTSLWLKTPNQKKHSNRTVEEIRESFKKLNLQVFLILSDRECFIVGIEMIWNGN